MPEKVTLSLRLLLTSVIVFAIVQIGIGILSFVASERGHAAVDSAKATATVAAASARELKMFVQCQAAFNAQTAAVQNPRSDAVERRDHALTRYLDFAAQFITQSGKPKQPTPEQQKRGAELFRALNRTSDRLDVVREKFPLPPSPASTCGVTP